MADIPRIAGLHTGPNPMSAVPPGATVEARNVVFRMPGEAEPRRGMPLMSYVPSTTNPPTGFYYFDGKVYAYTPGDTSLKYDSGAAWTLVSSALTKVGDRQTLAGFEAKQTHFWCSTTGARVQEVYNGTFYRAGMPRAADAVTTSSTTTSAWLANGSSAAYRYTWGYKDSYGRLIEGSPGGRIVYTNGTGSTASPILRIPIFTGASASFAITPTYTTGNFVRVYRSESVTTGAPSDNMYLVYEQKLSLASLTYTATKISKPNASSVCTADLVTHGLTTGDYVQVSTQTSTGAYFRNGIFQVTVTDADTFTYDDGLTNGSGSAQTNPVSFVINPCIVVTDFTPDTLLDTPLYTNPSDGEGVLQSNDRPPVAADALWWSNRAFYAGTTSKHRFTLRLLGISAAAGDNGLRAGDTITYDDGTTVYTFTGQAALTGAFDFVVATGGSASQNVKDTLVNFAQVFNARLAGRAQLYLNDDDTTAPGEFLIEEADIGTATAFKMYASRPASWAPYMTTSATNALTSSNDASVNRIFYSKLDQPDAVPAVNYFEIGAKNKKILRIAALSDALYVFKEDGIYTVSGQAPFTVDIYDPTIVLTEIESIAVGDNRIFGLAGDGVFSISTGGGVQRLGTPIYDKFLGTSATAAAGGIYTAENEYILSLPSTATTLVYNYSSNAWSDWTLANKTVRAVFERPRISSTSPAKLYFGVSGNTSNTGVVVENKAYTYEDYYDSALSRNITGTVSNGVVTLDSTTGVSVGDVLLDGQGDRSRISAVNGSNITLAESFTPEGGSVVIYTAYQCKVTMVPWFGDSFGKAKHFRAASVHFHTRQFYSGYLKFRTDLGPLDPNSIDVILTGDYTTATLSFSVGGTSISGVPTPVGLGSVYSTYQPATKRVLVPIPLQRGNCLQVGWQITEALSPWRLMGFTIDAETISDRGNS